MERGGWVVEGREGGGEKGVREKEEEGGREREGGWEEWGEKERERERER